MKAKNNKVICPAKVYADRGLTKPAREQDLVGWMKWGHSVILALWDENEKNWIPAIFADRLVSIATVTA